MADSAPGIGVPLVGMNTTPAPLASERVVVASPMSLSGSLARLRHLPSWAFWTIGLCALTVWWSVIVAWYLFFGLLLVPWRVLRRGSRKRKREALRHRETLDALNR